MARLGDRSAPLPGGRPGTLVLVGPLPPPSGGMANQTRQLARLLGAEGIDVRLVRTNAEVHPRWLAGVWGVRAAARLLPYAIGLWRALRDAELAHVMANSGWAWHFYAAPAIALAALRGVPALVNYRGGLAESFLARQIRFVRPVIALARSVVVPSEFLARAFARHGVVTTIVPNVVDLEAFAPAAAPPASPHLVVTRNLEAIYDIGTAIRSLRVIVARAPDARMTIAGEGPERAKLEALTRELGVAQRVTFTGRLDNSELPALYRLATVALNPSRVDNMPNSLLEAMASGVPVVSTDVGGVPFMAEDGRTALLVPAGDPEAMAAAVLRVLDEPALAGRLRAAALVHATQFSWQAVRPRLLAAYASAMAAPTLVDAPR